MAERFGLEPVVEVGEGDRALPTTRHPIRFSGTPVGYALPPPELDEHGAELRAWLATADVVTEQPTYPTALGASSRDTITLLGQDLAARRHGHASASASWRSGWPRSAAPSPARCGSSRRCSPRWPTTASPRPRSSPG